MLHKEVGKATLDSSVAFRWGVANTGTPNYLYYYQGISDALAGTTLMSNYGSGNTIGGSNTNQGIMLASGGLLRVRYGTEISLNDWKAKFSTTPMVLYYALATATDTEITNSALLTQLNTIYTLYPGANNISLVPTADAQGTMTIQYRLYDQYNKAHVYIWNDSLGDWQVIVP